MGIPILAAIKKEIEKSDIQIKEFKIITVLLIKDGVIQGTVEIYSPKRYIGFKAKSIILATGF